MKQTFKVLKISTYLLCGAFLLNSCNSGDTSTDTVTDSTTTATAPATVDTTSATPQKLTDPEIASIAVNADQIDIDYAAIAKEKSKNADVLKFAATMAKDHKSVNDQAVALATKLGVTPQDNPVTQSLLSGAATTKADLNSKSGADFDKAYIDNEVAYHKAAIDLVENKLIVDATNPELKSLLQTALPIFKQHLAHAEMIQNQFSK
jgi:putative membrane protein